MSEWCYIYPDYLSHHGIKGQKWGTRRYQNSDGSLTAEGRAHYGYGEGRKGSGEKSGSKEKKDHKKLKTALKVGAAVAGTALAAYGGYKLSQHIKGKAMDDILEKGRSKFESLVDEMNKYDAESELLKRTSLNYKQGSKEREWLAKESWAFRAQSSAAAERAGQAMASANKQAKEFKRSTLKSAKYLYQNRKKK
ncbi:MAG: hypothetical protein J6U54_09585 [Clostridiales bacterium]|nr:hypothetical protein [Clostridiales bacterium]